MEKANRQGLHGEKEKSEEVEDLREARRIPATSATVNELASKPLVGPLRDASRTRPRLWMCRLLRDYNDLSKFTRTGLSGGLQESAG